MVKSAESTTNSRAECIVWYTVQGTDPMHTGGPGPRSRLHTHLPDQTCHHAYPSAVSHATIMSPGRPWWSRDTGGLCPPAKTSHSPLDHCSRCSKPLSHQAVMGLLLTLLCHTLSPSLLSLYLSLLFYKEAEAALIGPGNSAGLCPDCPVSAGCFRTRDVLMSASLLVRKSLPDHKNVPFHDGPCA